MNRFDFTNMGNQNVVAYARGDVNGDKIADEVFLIGAMTSDSPFVNNITLIIQNGVTGSTTSITLKDNGGYNPSLFLGDFTGNGVCDILISIATGGSGGTYYYFIYTFVHNRVRLLFNSDAYNEQFKYEVMYLDNYKVEVRSIKNNTRYLIDLSLKGSDYLNEIYNDDGKLKIPISGWVDPISGLYPIDFDLNKVYELLAYQKIAGRYHADSLGYIQNTLKWNSRIFALDNQVISIIGSQG